MTDFETWVSSRPVTFHGDVVDWIYGKSHYVRNGMTLCGKSVGGDRWEKASYRTGHSVDCQRCLARRES